MMVILYCSLVLWLAFIRPIDLTVTFGDNHEHDSASRPSNPTTLQLPIVNGSDFVLKLEDPNPDMKHRNIYIFVKQHAPNMKMCRFSMTNKVAMSFQESETKNVSIFAHTLPYFIDSLIFVNFFKTFAFSFYQKQKQMPLGDVFAVLIHVIQLWNRPIYLLYFTFFNSQLNLYEFECSFTSVTILMLSCYMLNQQDDNHANIIKEFFKFILNDVKVHKSLKQIMKCILSFSQNAPPANINETDFNDLTEDRNSKDIRCYFNFAAIGILSQALTFMERNGNQCLHSNHDLIDQRKFVCHAINELWKLVSSDTNARQHFFIVNQIEFKEIVKHILSEIPSEGLRTDPSGFISGDEVEKLISPLVLFIDLFNVENFGFPLDSLNPEIVELCEEFLHFIKTLKAMNQTITDQLIKCLIKLKAFFSQFFLIYSSVHFYKLLHEHPSKVLKFMNDSMPFFTKISLISEIDETIKNLQKPTYSHINNNSGDQYNELQIKSTAHSIPSKHSRLYLFDTRCTETTQKYSSKSQINGTDDLPDIFSITDSTPGFDYDLNDSSNIGKKRKYDETTQFPKIGIKDVIVIQSFFSIRFFIDNVYRKDLAFSMKSTIFFLEYLYDKLHMRVNVRDILFVDASRIHNNYFAYLDWELKKSLFTLEATHDRSFCIVKSSLKNATVNLLKKRKRSDINNPHSACNSVEEFKRFRDIIKNLELTREERYMIMKLEDDFNTAHYF